MHARIQGQTHKQRSTVATTISRSLQATSEKKRFTRLFEQAFLCTSRKVFSDSLKKEQFSHIVFKTLPPVNLEKRKIVATDLNPLLHDKNVDLSKVNVDHKCMWFKYTLI